MGFVFLLLLVVVAAAVFVLLHPLVQVVMFAMLSPRSPREHHMAGFTTWLVAFIVSAGAAFFLLAAAGDGLDRMFSLR